MPLEIESIADGFNDTLEKLNEAITRQQEAQIVALEAQINPHFLYNTLDTINWMAIDRDEYDISNAISSLATILRYAIVNSNAEVSIREESEWIKKYIYLQQYRVKNRFSCSINVAPDTMDAGIHKLLLQPFVENAIVHGFEKDIQDAELVLNIEKKDENVEIRIEDNGSGMDDELMDMIQSKLGKRRFRGFKVDGIDIQIVCHPSKTRLIKNN
jgi:two-component system sensor histidine kinase YesM